MATTMQVIADRQNRPDDLIIAGEILDMRYVGAPLSLRASKLLHLLVKAAGARACENERHTIVIEELNKHFHLKVEDFIETVRELFNTQIRLEYQSSKGKKILKLGPLMGDMERDLEAHHEDDPAVLSWRFSEVLQMVLLNSTHWAALSKKAVLALTGRYSLRLYEMVALRKGLEKSEERFSIDDLRARLGVRPDKLQSWIHLRQRALDPAIAEVCQLTGLEISYKPIKQGQKTVGITLTWAERDPAGRAAVARELERSRIGRKARREGAVEKIFTPPAAVLAPAHVRFPADGDFRGTGFEPIARANLPEPMRDLDQVGRDFVKWAAAGHRPLAGDQVTKMFAGFCKTQKPAL